MTSSFAGLAAAFATHSKNVFLLAAISAACFWALEVQWKLFQLAYFERATTLERYFAGAQLVQHPFQITSTWNTPWGATRILMFLRIAVWPHVVLPHVLAIVAGVWLYRNVSP